MTYAEWEAALMERAKLGSRHFPAWALDPLKRYLAFRRDSIIVTETGWHQPLDFEEN